MGSKIARSIQQSGLPEPEVSNDLSNAEKNVHAAIISGLHMTFNTCTNITININAQCNIDSLTTAGTKRKHSNQDSIDEQGPKR
jgi:hypothetical protein